MANAHMKRDLISLALACGFNIEAVKKWRQRGHVPEKHRVALLRAARRRALKIDAEDFVFAGTAGTGRAQGDMTPIGALAKGIVRRLVYMR